VRELPRALRWYLGAIYGGCGALIAAQAPALPAALTHGAVPFAVVVFVLLMYLTDRAILQVTSSFAQSLGTTAHIAAILLFPPPLPLFMALIPALGVELRRPLPAYKRAFNACLPLLTVGLSSLAYARVAAPATLRPGHLAAALPAFALLLAVYYALDVGLMLGVFSLLERRPPWRVWPETHRPTLLPELGIAALGILAAAAWRFDPLLLALCALPAMALAASVRTTARALAAERRAEQALALASIDGLTGLLNHRAFHERLDAEIARGARSGRPLALVMIDLDDFRTINNSHGHQVGDAALVAIATAIRASIRTADVAGRYGGDEFAALLPEADLDEALAVAERTCAAVAAVAVEGRGATIRVGASLGVAVAPLHARTRTELIAAADAAAYDAKGAGKGRIRSAEASSGVTVFRRTRPG